MTTNVEQTATAAGFRSDRLAVDFFEPRFVDALYSVFGTLSSDGGLLLLQLFRTSCLHNVQITLADFLQHATFSFTAEVLFQV